MPASKKRKLGDDLTNTKYYAVRTGKKPGVYMTWAECQEHTTGFKGASYKSFPSKQEAEDFVSGKVKPTPSNGPPKFYGVAVGKVPGVYTNWDEALAQVSDGAKAPKYKKFETREEAEAFVKSGGKSSEVVKSAKAKDVTAVDEPSAKKIKVGASKKEGKMLRVWTDGSALGNGKVGSRAGVGVYFGQNDERNVSESLVGSAQTNNRAELTGILRALEIAPKDRPMEIITDSNYSINCVSVWYSGWQKKGWKKSDGGVVENLDLIKAIRALIDERDTLDTETVFTWIKGHNEDPGNEAADRLAVAGAHAGK